MTHKNNTYQLDFPKCTPADDFEHVKVFSTHAQCVDGIHGLLIWNIKHNRQGFGQHLQRYLLFMAHCYENSSAELLEKKFTWNINKWMTFNSCLPTCQLDSGNNFSEILIKIWKFAYTKMHLKISSKQWHWFCPQEDELIYPYTWAYLLQKSVLPLKLKYPDFVTASNSKYWNLPLFSSSQIN